MGARFRHAELLTSCVVVHARLGKHGVVLDLRLLDRRGVVADDDQLGCSTPDNSAVSEMQQVEDPQGF